MEGEKEGRASAFRSFVFGAIGRETFTKLSQVFLARIIVCLCVEI